jgi:hypothetical protein
MLEGETIALLKHLISLCEDNEDQLSEWERNFISSIKKQLTEKQTLSEKQIDILQKVSDKIK